MAEAYTNPFGEGSKPQTYDIVNDYDWTTAPAGSKLREQTPNAYVTAYKMEFSQLQQFINGYINIASSSARAEKLGTNPGLQFYKDMYSSSAVLADLNFPFFDDNIRGFSSEYENTFSPISQRAGTFLFGDAIEKLGGAAENVIGGTIAGAREIGNTGGNAMAEKVAGGVGAFGQMAGGAFEKLTGKKLPGLQTVGAPGSYIETPKFYQYSNTDEGINIEFVLSNTLNDYRGNKGFKQNLKFIKEFTMMNRPYRYGPIEMTFPAIYHIEIPGLRYIEWAYLENFGIKLIGARRRIGKNIIPEAYGFNFQFKSLTIEAANFVQMTDRVEGFDEGDASYKALREAADKDSASRAEEKKRELDAAQKRLEAAKAAEDKRKAEEEAKRKAEEERLLREDPDELPENAGGYGLPSPAEIARKKAEAAAETQERLAQTYTEQQQGRRAVSTTSGQTEEPELDYFEFNRRFNELEDSNEPSALTNFLRGENQAITNPEPEVPSTGDPITDRYLNNEEYVDNADNLQEEDRQNLLSYLRSQPAQANIEENREPGNMQPQPTVPGQKYDDLPQRAVSSDDGLVGGILQNQINQANARTEATRTIVDRADDQRIVQAFPPSTQQMMVGAARAQERGLEPDQFDPRTQRQVDVHQSTQGAPSRAEILSPRPEQPPVRERDPQAYLRAYSEHWINRSERDIELGEQRRQEAAVVREIDQVSAIYTPEDQQRTENLISETDAIISDYQQALSEVYPEENN